MRTLFTYLLLLVSGTALLSQTGSAAWFNSTVDRIELNDTVGITRLLDAGIDAKSAADRQLLYQLAYCNYYLTANAETAAHASLEKARHFDSLVSADSLHNLFRYYEGYYYFTAGNYQLALELLNESALAFNNTAHSILQARCFVMRGIIQQSLNYPADAKKSFEVALKFYRGKKIVKREASTLNNLSLTSRLLHDSAQSSQYILRSLALRDSILDSAGVGQCYNNLGTLMYDYHHYEAALDYYQKGYDYRVKAHAPRSGIIESQINIGKALRKTGKAAEAIGYLEKSLAEAGEMQRLELQRRACEELMQIYFEQQNFEKAYKTQSLYFQLQDSLYGQSKKEEIVRMTVKYDFMNREKQDSLRRAERERAEANIRAEEEKRTNLIIIALLSGLALAGFFVYNLYKSNQAKKRSNEIIRLQRDTLDKKQQEITESIQYAKYIQQAILPSDAMLKNALPEHFVFYQPKDIVSGDFYWLHVMESEVRSSKSEVKSVESSTSDSELQTSDFLLAVADCTGHGVPGAFMSLLAKENLDKAAGVTQSPGGILAILNRAVKRSLHQDAGTHSTRDGLDIALVRLQGKRLTYSGANRPLWIVRKGVNAVEEVKATKAAIGGFTNDEQVFEEVRLEPAAGDTVYLFTDGYADQFGGDRLKKLTTKKFRELLLEIHTLPMQVQETRLREFFTGWKNDQEQVDDILVIGVRF